MQQADIGPVGVATEPEAAAVHYASTTRVAPGEVVAVYDLGGGTFDAAVLRNTGNGFELLGDPRGIEQLGGVYFDEAVFAYVVNNMSEAFSKLDPDDPGTVAAVARLRRDCVEAKETLSWDTDTAIPVALPNQRTDVRLTRAEFEDLIRPALSDTVEAMRRALASAGLEPESVKSVLLVGGSSRIPLVGQMLMASLRRPVAIDVHPKHAVALGAAHLSAAAGDQLAQPSEPLATMAPAVVTRVGGTTVTTPAGESRVASPPPRGDGPAPAPPGGPPPVPRPGEGDEARRRPVALVAGVAAVAVATRHPTAARPRRRSPQSRCPRARRSPGRPSPTPRRTARSGTSGWSTRTGPTRGPSPASRPPSPGCRCCRPTGGRSPTRWRPPAAGSSG